MENTCSECHKKYYLNDCEIYFKSKVCQSCRQKDFHSNSIKPIENSLWVKRPNIAKQWVTDLNKTTKSILIEGEVSTIESEVLPIDITFRSRRGFSFSCSKCAKILKVFLNNASRSDEIICYDCARLITGESNSLPKGLAVSDSPELLKIWDYESNAIDPSRVALQSNRKYYWLCSRKHRTLTSPANKNKGKGCKECMEKYFVSQPEIELRDFIKTFYSKRIEFNRKSYIYPYELDIVLPEDNIAIEFNGVYFHSDSKIFEKHKMTARMYHLMKESRCSKVGLDLLFIWEDDWYNTKEQVMEILKNRVLHGIKSEALKRLEV